MEVGLTPGEIKVGERLAPEMFNPMCNHGDRIEFWQSGDWTAVYLNGNLVRFGDHYLADEWLQGYVGVKVVSEDKGGHHAMLPHGPSDAHHRLADVHAARDEANRRKERAERLRAQAADILAEAERVENGEGS